MPNQLINETSPYLLQHAHNPVNWYPWGEAALQKAREEDKPIFLSIGYAACHWCHVMEKESFENPAIADIMNQFFVNVKVDREERPDLDAIYMDAVVALTGQGGWPMSVWLTPDGVPFYGGTYFPPNDRMGMPGLGRLMQTLADFYHRQKDAIQKQGEQLLARMNNSLSLANPAPFDAAVLDAAAQSILRNIDFTHGGTQGAPKFPQPMIYDFLLRQYARTGDVTLLGAVEITLQKMATGGIYDQLGGGFHRYATDAEWLVPHFEKMLYDNALLVRLYLHAFQITGKPLYRRVVDETLAYIRREMTHPAGGFFSTQDADSDGEEGKFFVWTAEEVLYLLGDTAAEHFSAVYDVTRRGNWAGKSILRQKQPPADVAASLGMDEAALAAELAASRKILFDRRETRIKPARDEKILTAWNGMMLAAFAEAGRVLDNADYIAVARRNADFLLENLRTPDGRLWRTWKDGRAKLNGYLEDYAFFADGLLALYQTTFDEQYFSAARELMDTVLTHFRDPADGGFFDTADDHPELVVRPKNLQDNATPSGNAVAVRTLLLLAAYTGDDRYFEPAAAALGALQPVMQRYPLGFGHWLGTATLIEAGVQEIALVGDVRHPEMAKMLSAVQKPYRPFQVVALSSGGETVVPLLYDRPAQNGKPTAYVCQNFACQLPVTTAAALRKQI